MSQSVRVCGTVLNVVERSGTSKAGNPWSMTEAKIFVAERDVTTVLLGDLFQGRYGVPVRGDDIDLMVSVRASGGFLNLDAVEPWPEVDHDTGPSSKPAVKSA